MISYGSIMNEDDYLSISGLSHLIFCERRFALVHIEQIWVDNQYTAEGSILHERVHSNSAESRRNVRYAFGLSLISRRLGLIGKADTVEFRRTDNSKNISGNNVAIQLSGVQGLWQPLIVEYKSGSPKIGDSNIVQLCAQAICLEEMLNVNIDQGAIFYGKIRKRLNVEFDENLRKKTEHYAERLHTVFRFGKTVPPLKNDKRCKKCSLYPLCMPDVLKDNIEDYLYRSLSKD
jgi:CRISPR-associated exonuclease Cas4